MFVCYAINRLISRFAFACMVVALAGAFAFGQESTKAANAGASKLPSIRYVSSSQAELLAGPGDDFYPTSIVKRGQSLEVQQETEDGWLAITPPAGSFSWLPASQGLLLPGGRIVEVTEKSAVSWIGSTLGTAKQYRWQVKLERGQQLAVIGEQTIPDPATGSKSLWLKIVPPAGEYRWIQTKATSKQPPEDLNSVQTAQSNKAGAAESIVTEDSLAQSSSDDGQVVPASAQQPVATKSHASSALRNGAQGGARRTTGNSAAHQHDDRWDDWHAMEFKNGSFSFPGMARMLGMQPPPKNNRAAGNGATKEDPFDLTASYTRANAAPRVKKDNGQQNSSTMDDTELEPSAMVARQSRGWRDPRQLRQDRMRGALGEQLVNGYDSDLSMESALARDDRMEDSYAGRSQPEGDYANSMDEGTDATVMDAGYDESGEVGSAVVTAGASEVQRTRAGSRSSNSRSQSDSSIRDEAGGTDQAWYGIEQAPTSRPVRQASTQASLNDIQLELSSMVAGPEHTWNLAPLADRARYYIEHGQNSIERGQARLLLERIDSFAAVASQATAPAGMPSRLASSTNGPVRALPAVASKAPGGVAPASWVAPAKDPSAGAEANGSQFDATGWLVPVHSNGREMPTHALTNDAGKIIVYVTPAPGVNLTRFESQAIGVFGLRGYLPQLKTNHIQIQRVVRLQ